MAVTGSACPANSFLFNSTLCVCNPGYLLNPSPPGCDLFRSSPEDWKVSSGVGAAALKFPVNILSFDSIEKLTNPQAVFLEATLITVVSWLAFCLAVRLGRVDGGRSVWFTVRWWISRLDFLFASQHWLDDQKVVKKRKTELGGTFSIASWILSIGLLAALLYHIIAKRTVEVNSVKALNAPDLTTFVNDLEFNITTISRMSCSHLRGLGNLVMGTPGSIYHRVSALSNFAQYTCLNTSHGPTIAIRCDGCHVPRDSFYISWQFVDIQGNPAMAVGFQFNLTAKAHGDSKHVSFVSGILKNGSELDDIPITFRGPNVNILQFSLFPRLYHNFHNLHLIQPLFHQFLPGSYANDSSELQASLQNSEDGLINTTLHLTFLSDYVIETDHESTVGPGMNNFISHFLFHTSFVGSVNFLQLFAHAVGFLADAGGLFSFSCAIFLYTLWLCEHKIKKLRNEDTVMREIRGRNRAKLHWDKLRKFVMYTWGIDSLEEKSNSGTSLHKRKPYCSEDSITLGQSVGTPIETIVLPKATQNASINSNYAQNNVTQEGMTLTSESEKEKGNSSHFGVGNNIQSQPFVGTRASLPLPPLPEISFESGADISVLQKNLQSLYDYNIRLSERLAATENLLEDLRGKTTLPSNG